MRRNKLDSKLFTSQNEAFRAIARKQRAIKAKMLELADDLDDLSYQSDGVKGVSFEPKIGTSGSVDVRQTDIKKLRMFEKQDKLIYRYDCYARLDYWLENILSRGSNDPKLPFIMSGIILKGAYGCPHSLRDIASEYGMSVSTFQEKMVVFIENNVTENDVHSLNNVITTLYDEDLKYLSLVAK